jgi:heme oxygenase (biliverdin-IX-beta and delta-forming)
VNPTHLALRDGTAAAHERVDAAFAGFDLTERASYARFLAAHAEVVWALEGALAGGRVTADWEERKRGALLREDLAHLRPLAEPTPATSEDLTFDTVPEIAGALYVLEGSRLGGKFLARRLPAGFPRAYLDSDQPSAEWRKLLDCLDTILYDAATMQSALAAAHRVFSAFERAATRWARD